MLSIAMAVKGTGKLGLLKARASRSALATAATVERGVGQPAIHSSH